VGLVFAREAPPFDAAALGACLDDAMAAPGLERFKGVFRTTLGWVLAQWVRGDTVGTREPISRAADSRLQFIFEGPPPPPEGVVAMEEKFFAALGKQVWA